MKINNKKIRIQLKYATGIEKRHNVIWPHDSSIYNLTSYNLRFTIQQPNKKIEKGKIIKYWIRKEKKMHHDSEEAPGLCLSDFTAY